MDRQIDLIVLLCYYVYMKNAANRSETDQRLHLLERVSYDERIPRVLRFAARVEAAPRRWQNDQMDRMDAWTQRFVERADAKAEASRVDNARRLAEVLRKGRELRDGPQTVQAEPSFETPPHASQSPLEPEGARIAAEPPTEK